MRKAAQKAHLLEGLILALSDIDAIIDLIKKSADPKAAREALMARPLRLAEQSTVRNLLPEDFVRKVSATDQNLTQVQADAILSMQLQKLTGLEVEKLARDYSGLIEEIRGYEAILKDERLIFDIIREDLYEMKEKHGNPRRTDITEAIGEFSMEELIPDEQTIVTVSHEGYIKRVDADTYRTQGRGGRGVKGGDTREGDYIEYLFTASTHDYLLVFTNRGRVYWQKVYDVPAMARTARGRAIANLVQFQQSETLRAILPVRAFEENFAFFATSKGVVKKTPLGAFRNPRSNGIIAISLDPDAELINVEQTSGEAQVVLGSRNGMAIRFNETNVRAMGRTAKGVRGMGLRGDDRVVDMAVAAPGASLLTVCENGHGKRTDIEEYRLIRRGGKGVINIKTTERNGKVVALKAVRDSDELMMITSKGIMLRTKLDAVREIGRATQGVRLIKLDEADKLVAVTRVAQEEANGAENDTQKDAEPENSGPQASQSPEE